MATARCSDTIDDSQMAEGGMPGRAHLPAWRRWRRSAPSWWREERPVCSTPRASPLPSALMPSAAGTIGSSTLHAPSIPHAVGQGGAEGCSVPQRGRRRLWAALIAALAAHRPCAPFARPVEQVRSLFHALDACTCAEPGLSGTVAGWPSCHRAPSCPQGSGSQTARRSNGHDAGGWPRVPGSLAGPAAAPLRYGSVC